jgi:hypothetical protein
MSDKLLNHILDNLYNFDDNIKLSIKQFYIPKYIDINVNNIDLKYRHLIPSRISTISLKNTLNNIVKYYKNDLHCDNIRNCSIYAVAMAYLQSIGLNQGLDKYDYDYACSRSGILGVYYDDNMIVTITLSGIIHELVGFNWTNN